MSWINVTVEETKAIDIISSNVDRDVVNLIITDHLEWDSEGNHLLTLQDKINTYLTFIESGVMIEKYPELERLTPTIKVVLKHRPNQMAERFFERVSEICRNAGILFEAGPREIGYYDKDS